GHVQQGLRRNAAAEQTRAAQSRIGLNDGYFQPLIGRQKRGGIAARTAAEDDDWRMHLKAATSGRGSLVLKIKEPKNQRTKLLVQLVVRFFGSSIFGSLVFTVLETQPRYSHRRAS